MSLIRWSPMFDPFEEMERAMREFQSSSERTFVPAMDVFKDKNDVVAKVPITGFDPKNIDVSVKDGVLTIKGKTEKKTEVDEKSYYRKEIKSGSFQRSVLLPSEVEEGKVKADYEEGVLEVRIPMKKANAGKSTSVKVNVKKNTKKKVKPRR